MDIALLYRARIAPVSSSSFQPALPATLDEIGARRAALGVTGVLLVADGYVYELLEGDFSTVSGLFGMVLADDRLADIEMLSNATITRHVCNQWSHGVVSEEAALPVELAAKVQMLHHFAQRFGSSQPVLRDFLARIGQDIAAPACRLTRSPMLRYAMAS